METDFSSVSCSRGESPPIARAWAIVVVEPSEVGLPQRVHPGGSFDKSTSSGCSNVPSNVTSLALVLIVILPLPYTEFIRGESCSISSGGSTAAADGT